MAEDLRYYAFVSSEFRDASQYTTSKYVLPVPGDTLRCRQHDQFIRLTLKSFSFINDIPSVHPTFGNDTLIRSGNEGLTLPAGFYKVSDLTAWWKTNVPQWRLSYDGLTNKFSFVPLVANVPIQFKSAAGPLFGFAPDFLLNTATTSAYPIKIRQVNEILLNLRNVNTGPAINISCVDNTFRPTSLLGIIPLHAFPFGMNYWENVGDSYSMDIYDENVNQLHFELTDINGSQLPWLPDHTFTLRVDVIHRSSRLIERRLDSIIDLLRMLVLYRGLKMQDAEGRAYHDTEADEAVN